MILESLAVTSKSVAADQGTTINTFGERLTFATIVRFIAKEDSLICEIDASTDEQREGMKGAVARHLDRFAFREAPFVYDWKDN